VSAVPSLLEWIEATTVAGLVRDTLWGFQIVVAIHIMGMIVSVGLLAWMDLRLLGVALTRFPVSLVVRRLMPLFTAGFAVMFLSGGALFTGYATAAYGNRYFRLKMLAIALAGVNALVYHFVTERGIAAWDRDRRPPRAVRAAGLISLALWTGVILAGRLMSYTMF
jgi:hypothetical protein